MSERLMPDRFNLGKSAMSVIAGPMTQYRDWKDDPEGINPTGGRTVMGYVIPEWQRPLVWTDGQMTSFMESVWRGLPLGSFTYNRAEIGSPLDGLLIDGQQRLHSLQCYLEDQFPVFGYRWSEVTAVDKRFFMYSTTFASYITETENVDYLKEYYNIMNFGGTAHKESERVDTTGYTVNVPPTAENWDDGEDHRSDAEMASAEIFHQMTPVYNDD